MSMLYSFRNDYSEGANPEILQALEQTNLRQSCGYGTDPICEAARARIRDLCNAPEADIHFLVGGTQANALVIESLLRPYEAAICANTGHINVHEAGAVEATGHKVCPVPSPDGKLTPSMVESVLKAHSSEHMVVPRLVYLSDTTEVGTLYTKSELTALRQLCDVHGLYLFVDGARLASALTSPENDLTLADLAALTDVFYIGGTKNGALFGEAVVMPRPHPAFRWHMKQRGALLAKGWLLGLQFLTLFQNDLFFANGRHANQMAFRLRDGIEQLGYPFPVPSPSNQQFPVLPNPVIAKLQEMGYEFEIDGIVDEQHTRIRLVTSWATPPSAVEDFLQALSQCRE